MSACLRAEERDEDGERSAPSFPRFEDGRRRAETARGDVLLRVHQRFSAGEGGRPSCFEVRTSPEDGRAEIPLVVSATTVGAWLPGEVLRRSPWLARSLDAPAGATATRLLAGDLGEEGDGAEAPGGPGEGGGAGADRPPAAAVACRRVAQDALELGLPSRGAGRLLSSRGLLECLELGAAHAAPREALGAAPARRLLALLLWATVLELPGLAEVCREALLAAVDTGNLALVLAGAHAAGDGALLQLCYWRLREALLGAGGAPRCWLDGRGPVRLARGRLAAEGVGSTPLAAFRRVLEQDLEAKARRWLAPADGYTLCRVHRRRAASGGYPHRYELRLDHSDELLLSALREDEQAACRLFEGDAAAPGASEHCAEFLGSVVPNFWGTSFELHDSGAELEGLAQRAPATAGLPLCQRRRLCRVGYETNILGDCPRKVTVDFERGGARHHMENVAPRWDKKLNSYALPFFGRVKKASAKNFQLVVDGDPTTIFLMFGKISKDVFCLDFRGPLALLDAAAIALAALAKKRAVS